ncbi:TRAP transporter small permease subunit [Hydrogenophaga sp.]|uniref:TRAP transporter small permease n=1 Tax=Hydrogenophaga sp. TaxID=1904254 RepID=UPI0025C42B29|nr:TRAP transporter small permease subunit [Hydrogenophaga sp.]MBT9467289.1 TRAP transporter small permease subunit [Hydrogenophaga sp.]
MKPGPFLKHAAEALLALCLAGMVVCVFGNVVLRYGFNSGINATEELSRLLFVWMVFLGATAAYPVGQHMAFTSLVGSLRDKPMVFATATLAIRLLVLLACVLLGRGAWQQVVVGMDSNSVVLGYPVALLPLPALLCALAIGLMVLIEIVQRAPLDLGHQAEME